MSGVIIRNQYLDRLIKERDNELIKIITGLRRSGKTYLLMMYKNYLLSNGVSENQIVYINFESFSNEHLLDNTELYNYVIKLYDKKKLYLLFDEVQLVNEWQKVVNSFRIDIEADIYITGSNASILSGELATLIAGRYTEINVFPLSFKEFINFRKVNIDDKVLVNKEFIEYFEFGGMPVTLGLKDEVSKYDYLSSVYDSIILRDISSREGGAKNTDTFRKIALFLMDSISSEISINKLENRLKDNKIGVGRATLNNYLKLMEEAFIFYNVKKYDIKGSNQFGTNGKYYISDIGLWNSQIKKTKSDLGNKLENLVFIELMRRKYDIQVGSINSKEIDFVATRNNERKYIQVAYEIPKKSEREFANLLDIKDNYEKILITYSNSEDNEYKGIKIINIIDWLLEDVL